MNKPKKYMDSTGHNRVYRLARKAYLAGRGIKCTFCPYHAKENTEHKPQRSWKKFRRHQWR